MFPRLPGAAVAALPSACGGGGEAVEAPRPVLVGHPRGGADAAVVTYAGEIRAREESPLALRIGGNLVRRHVDAGERVHKGQVLAERTRATSACRPMPRVSSRPHVSSRTQ